LACHFVEQSCDDQHTADGKLEQEWMEEILEAVLKREPKRVFPEISTSEAL
jgi:hypothetical protein